MELKIQRKKFQAMLLVVVVGLHLSWGFKLECVWYGMDGFHLEVYQNMIILCQDFKHIHKYSTLYPTWLLQIAYGFICVQLVYTFSQIFCTIPRLTFSIASLSLLMLLSWVFYWVQFDLYCPQLKLITYRNRWSQSGVLL
jgi:hypothetical protein